MNINDSLSINRLTKPQLIHPSDSKAEDAEQKQPGKFDELFSTVFAASNSASQELSEASRESAAKLVSGQLDDLTEHLVTSEKSSIMFELNLTVRSKILDAYSEIMKTQM